jgi:Flp pilus assembly protein CpaB
VRRVAAGLLAATALALAVRPTSAPGRATADRIPVVVAARDLPPGTALRRDDVVVARWPPETVPDGMLGDPGEATGRVPAGPVRRGEPLTDVRFVGNRLTARLPAGLVAAPVRLADLAVSSLVAAGDRVDVLAAAPAATTAEIVAAGVLVLAATGPAASDGGTDRSGGGLLLVAVDGPTAARLAAAATSATLTISLPGR